MKKHPVRKRQRSPSLAKSLLDKKCILGRDLHTDLYLNEFHEKIHHSLLIEETLPTQVWWAAPWLAVYFYHIIFTGGAGGQQSSYHGGGGQQWILRSSCESWVNWIQLGEEQPKKNDVRRWWCEITANSNLECSLCRWKRCSLRRGCNAQYDLLPRHPWILCQ